MSDVESSTTSQPTVTRKRRPSSLSWSLPRPISRGPRKTFWVAGRSEIPCYSCSPWKFYEPFVKLKSDLFLVLCNARTDVRVISSYLVEQYGKGPWFPEFQHPSFVDIYELYHVGDEIFAVSEYLDFSLEDLLLHSIRLAEPEIAFIISRVRWISSFIQSRADCSRCWLVSGSSGQGNITTNSFRSGIFASLRKATSKSVRK
jgi:hypothetical protein